MINVQKTVRIARILEGVGWILNRHMAKVPGRHMAKLILYGKGRIAGGIGCITGNSIKILSGYYCIWDVAVPELTSFKQQTYIRGLHQ